MSDLTPPSAAEGSPPAERETSIMDVVNVLLRYRLSLVLVPLLCGALGAASALRQARTYRASATFMLKGDNGAQGISGLAAQLGVAVPGKGGESPQLYADLLTSRRLLDSLAATPFHFTHQGERHAGTYASLEGLEQGPAGRDEVRHALASAVNARTNLATGVINFSISTRWPELAELMTDRLLQLVTEWNLSTRQSQAASERTFTGQRLTEARGEMRRAEDAVQSFLQGNHGFESSPRLLFEYQRLQRVALSRQELFGTLEQAYETARINEVRDTPVLTVIEGGANSAVPNSRGTLLRTLLGLIVGLMLAVVAAFFRDFVRRSREADTPAMREYLLLRGKAVAGLQPPRGVPTPR